MQVFLILILLHWTSLSGSSSPPFSLSMLFLRPTIIATLLGIYLCSLEWVYHILPNYFPHDWHMYAFLSATLSNVWHPWECSSQTSDLRKVQLSRGPSCCTLKSSLPVLHLRSHCSLAAPSQWLSTLWTLRRAHSWETWDFFSHSWFGLRTSWWTRRTF